jgi:uncharacterized protein YdgA (DUF945 family)
MHKPVLPIVAVVVLALLLGLPPVLGMLTESQVNARVAAMADDALLTARVESYERGWFGSRARIELALGRDYTSRLQSLGTSTEPSARSAMILVDFAHGPIAIRDGAQLGLSTMVARIDPDSADHRELLTRLGVPYLFEFRGRTGFLGRLTFEADAPPLDLAADDAAVLFSGALLEGSFGGGTLDYAARVDAFDLRSGDAAFAARGLAAEGRNEVRAFLPLGPATFTLERLTIDDTSAQGAPALDATSLRFTTDLRLDDDGVLISGEQTLAADSVSVAPAVTVRDAAATLGYRNLDGDALTAYARALQRGAAAGNVDPYLLLTEVTPSIERLLAAGPSLLVEPLRFTVNGEPFDGRFMLNVRPGAMPPAGALDLRDVGLWADVLQLTAEATVSKVLARSVAVQLTAAQLAAGGAVPPSQIEAMAEAQVGLILLTLIGQGLVTDDGETYTLRVDLTDGALSVNGVPLPFGVP